MVETIACRRILARDARFPSLSLSFSFRSYRKSLYVDPVDPNCKVRFLWLRIETVMLGDLGAESDKASPSLVGCRSLWWLLFLNAS